MAAAYSDYDDSGDCEDYEDDECSSSKQNTPRSFRQARGIFEAEISCVEELNLHEHMSQCDKNPGHRFFIPAGEFSMNNLPPRYQDSDIVELVQALSKITVRISVKYTSLDRPDYYPDSDDKRYPAAELKGTTSLRTGSGWVSRVSVHTRSKYNNKHCPCQECKKSYLPQQQWAFIHISTATHMVYDEKEGAKTTCHFFYDNNDKHFSDLPSLHGATRVHTEVDGDACRMTYITHDIRFANDLQYKWREFKSLHTSVGEKYNANSNDGQVIDRNDHNLTIIVSHPHGCSKHISVGKYTMKAEMDYNDAFTKYTYTTPTCPGSSGAPVYILSRWWWWGCDHPHGGQCEENADLNYSGIAMY